MSLTAFLATLSNLDQRVAANLAGELGTPLLTQAVDDALNEYSSYRPRGFRKVEITIAVDDEEIELPADFLIDSSTNQSALFLIRYGYERSRHAVPGSYPLVRSSALPRADSALGATTDPPGFAAIGEPTTIPLTTTDTGNYAVLLFEPATTERTHTIRYHARHQICDASDGPPAVTAKNTVPFEDRRLVRALALGKYAAEAKGREVLRTITPDLLPIAREWFAQAERQANEARAELQAGFGSIWGEGE